MATASIDSKPTLDRFPIPPTQPVHHHHHHQQQPSPSGSPHRPQSKRTSKPQIPTPFNPNQDRSSSTTPRSIKSKKSPLILPILPNLYDPSLPIDQTYPSIPFDSTQTIQPGLSRSSTRVISSPISSSDQNLERTLTLPSGYNGQFTFRMEITEINHRLAGLHLAISADRRNRVIQIQEAMKIAMERLDVNSGHDRLNGRSDPKPVHTIHPQISKVQEDHHHHHTSSDQPVMMDRSARVASINPSSNRAQDYQNLTVLNQIGQVPPSGHNPSKLSPSNSVPRPAQPSTSTDAPPSLGSSAAASDHGPSGPPPSEPPPPLPHPSKSKSSYPSTPIVTADLSSDRTQGQNKKNNGKKGKKKRSAHANANNVHHRDNYIPSRLPTGYQSNQRFNSEEFLSNAASDWSKLNLIAREFDQYQQNSSGDYRFIDPNLSFLGPNNRPRHHYHPHLAEDPDLKPNGGSYHLTKKSTGASTAGTMTTTVGAAALKPHCQLGPSPIARFFAEPDEWICSFCEYELWFGEEISLFRVIKNRKQVLKRRRRAKERAARAASGIIPAVNPKNSTCPNKPNKDHHHHHATEGGTKKSQDILDPHPSAGRRRASNVKPEETMTDDGGTRVDPPSELDHLELPAHHQDPARAEDQAIGRIGKKKSKLGDG